MKRERTGRIYAPSAELGAVRADPRRRGGAPTEALRSAWSTGSPEPCFPETTCEAGARRCGRQPGEA